MSNSLPPDSKPAPPPAVWGRWFCITYLLLFSLPVLLMSQSIVAALIILLLWGGIPAGLLLWFPPKGEGRGDKILYGLAIAALYLVFGGFFLYGTAVSASDAQGGLVYLFLLPWTHGVWALFGAPYLLRRWWPEDEENEA